MYESTAERDAQTFGAVVFLIALLAGVHFIIAWIFSPVVAYSWDTLLALVFIADLFRHFKEKRRLRRGHS